MSTDPLATDLLAYVLSCLRRAADNAYPWSLTPTEAGAVVAEVERLRTRQKEMYEEAMDTSYALSEEGENDGYRPERGKSDLVDRALDMREEVERLRAERHLDNADLAHAYDFARDKGATLERGVVLDYLAYRIEMSHYGDAIKEFIDAREEIADGVHHTIDYKKFLP